MERKRQAHWDMKHLKTVSTKLTLWQYADLKRACETIGITPYALLKRVLEHWMEAGAGDTQK